MKLGLGTVQFGLNYGINNPKGKLALDEIESILNFAKNNKIDLLDTAPSYGDSENVLGQFGVDDCKIITKTTSLANSVDNVINIFYKSLDNLGQTHVQGLLVHDFNDTENKLFYELYERLNELKCQGLIKQIGFSTYTPNQVNFLIENFDFDMIQVPLNVFDIRLIEGGQLQELKKRKIEIHTRSVFLQGLLVDFSNLSNYFCIWRDQFNLYQDMVQNSGLSLLEYALNFSLNIEEIDKVIVGVNGLDQLREIVKSATKKEALKAYPIGDTDLLNPSLWK